jgi:hypothetical protein
MTAIPDLPPITCASSLVASCGPLLGFEPEHCVVAFVLGVPGRPGPVLVRLDLGAAHDADVRAHELAAAIAGTGGSAVDLVAWVDAVDGATRASLPSAPFLDELAMRLIDRGVDVVASLSTNGRVWWSHECPDEGCCGGPRPLDQAVMTAIRAEYAYAGYAPLAGRDDLVARLAPDRIRVARLRALAAGWRAPANLERWRDAQIGYLTALLVPGGMGGASTAARGRAARAAGTPLDPRVAARMLRGLSDIVVRDTVLLRLIRSADPRQEQWRQTIELLCDTVRCAPDLHVAPAATLLACVAWMRGEGSLANVALDRAEEDHPSYRLAALTREVITRGMDPRVWAASMAGLTEAEIRSAGRCTPGLARHVNPGDGGGRPDWSGRE